MELFQRFCASAVTRFPMRICVFNKSVQEGGFISGSRKFSEVFTQFRKCLIFGSSNLSSSFAAYFVEEDNVRGLFPLSIFLVQEGRFRENRNYLIEMHMDDWRGSRNHFDLGTRSITMASIALTLWGTLQTCWLNSHLNLGHSSDDPFLCVFGIGHFLESKCLYSWLPHPGLTFG